jgi:hypothetical protein
LGNNYGEQLCGFAAALTEQLLCFEKPQLWGLTLERDFGGAAFGSNFAEQLSGATLENSFGELLWGTGLKHSRFGVAALPWYFGNDFGQQLQGTALGSSFGERSRFEK